MREFIGTFSINSPLGNCFVRIPAECLDGACQIIRKYYRFNWARVYPTEGNG